MKARLKKDIVIKAGTIFHDAPTRTERSGDHIEYIFGLTKNTTGSLVYAIEDLTRKEWDKWFERI